MNIKNLVCICLTETKMSVYFDTTISLDRGAADKSSFRKNDRNREAKGDAAEG